MRSLLIVSSTIASLFFSLIVSTKVVASPTYDAEVRRTSFGIPHIKADNWGGLGYGYGYAYASDNLCILAREIVEANGEQALYFGGSNNRITSDLYYTLVNSQQTVDAIIDQMDAEVVDGIKGFAAGYNRYLNETGVDNLAAACRSQAWVREIDEVDMFKVYNKLILRASGGPVSSLIVSAQPPSVPQNFNVKEFKRAKNTLFKQMARADLSGFDDLLNPEELGSNMYALGANATQSGRGMLLGNPHFPWEGPLRWYQAHLTIPGVVDVMGASLQGVPLINIGFTDEFAWSHTVSPADRFTIFELDLVPGSPTQYFYDGEVLDMEQTTVTIQSNNNGVIENISHTFYRSIQGWILDITPLLGFPVWQSGTTIFALGDANEANFRAINQFYRMNIADEFDDFVGVLKDQVGLPWVHTVAASRGGDAFYGDLSVMPNVSAQKLSDCAPDGVGTLLVAAAGLRVLEGGDSACAWEDNPLAPQPGIVPAEELPTLETQDYVTNSNDSYWLTNPDMPITGIVPIAGGEEFTRSLRTRLGLVQVQERLSGSDGQGAPGYTLETLKNALFDSRNYLAELILDDLVQLCFDEGATVAIDGETIDLQQACDVLSNWDKKQNVESFGPHIFLEFIQSMFDQTDDQFFTVLWEVPFDLNDPVNTPRGLNQDTPEERAQLMRWLGQGVKRLQDLGIAMDAMWGDLQYSTKNGVRYPIHGGRDGTGMFSIITAGLSAEGYTPIDHGNSYMQAVTFDDNGPVAEALLSYSQSSDPDNPHYADQTALYTNKQWVSLPFHEADILADPNYTTITITEIKDSDSDGIGDDIDNCTEVANFDQRDTDGDGYGNLCDPDFNNDEVINFLDLAYFASVFGTADADADLNGDGAVNFLDLTIIRNMFYGAPGPAADIVNPVSFASDVQPIFQNKCAPCHTGTVLSAFNFAGSYESNLLNAEIPQCAGLTVGACTLVRIQSGEMPVGAGCSGDPVQDAANSACLTLAEQTTVQNWINGGLAE